MSRRSQPSDADDHVEIGQRRKSHLVISAILLVGATTFIALLAIGLGFNPKNIPATGLDKQARPFSVAWISGQADSPDPEADRLELKDFVNQPIIVNFWASWCISCREEARELEAFWQAYGSQIPIVGIAVQDEEEAAKKFAAYFGKTYILGLDESGKTSIDYGVSGVPETFLIDGSGMIRHKIAGPVTRGMLEELVKQHLPSIGL